MGVASRERERGREGEREGERGRVYACRVGNLTASVSVCVSVSRYVCFNLFSLLFYFTSESERGCGRAGRGHGRGVDGRNGRNGLPGVWAD